MAEPQKNSAIPSEKELPYFVVKSLNTFCGHPSANPPWELVLTGIRHELQCQTSQLHFQVGFYTKNFRCAPETGESIQALNSP